MEEAHETFEARKLGGAPLQLRRPIDLQSRLWVTIGAWLERARAA